MTQIKIKKARVFPSGEQFFPITHTKAVIDDNGYTAESRLQAMQDEINQAQMAIGAVPSDLTPTEDSTNWVTSGGVYNAIGVVKDKVSVVSDTGYNPANESRGAANLSNITFTTTDKGFTAKVIAKKGTSTNVYMADISCNSLHAGKTYRMEFDYVSEWDGSIQVRDSDYALTESTLTESYIIGSGHILVEKTIDYESSWLTLLLPQNTAVGKTFVVSNLVISEVSAVNDKVVDLADEVEAIVPTINALTADAIDASGLECSVRKTSGSGTTITIENTSENNYTIHCITKAGYTYVLIKLPSGLVAGKQYKITYTYSSTSSSTANLVFANASYSNVGGFSQFLANTRNKQVSVVYTHQSNYVYLMTFNNDISTGADITINDLTIIVPHSITEIEDRISALEPTVTPSAYYNGMHVELGNDYGYVFTTTSTSIRCNEGMAMYGDYLVCAMVAAGTTYLNVYKKTDGVYSLVESFSNMSLSHANAMQFAPTLDSGQTFPLLYVAGCTDRKCYVVQISVTSETVDDVTTDTYSASIVQTISLPTTEIFATTQSINVQIGDDGYLYVYHLNHGCIRLRCPKVSEGEAVTMTEEDVYDYYEFHYPYATYVWQGGVIHKGMLFMPVGNTNKTKCLFVFDIYNHSLKALINLDAFMGSGEEPEDAEVHNGELYIAMYAGASATSSKAMKKIRFL